MNSDNAMEVGNDSLRMARIASEWYALNPDVMRLWVYGPDKTDPNDKGAIHVVVALVPVGDSDDISPIWLARCTGWQTRLRELIGCCVHLDWFDGETEVLPCAHGAEHARVCLASIAWRDPSAEMIGELAGRHTAADRAYNDVDHCAMNSPDALAWRLGT